MIPYHDENKTQRPAYVAMALVAVNAFAWLFVQGAGAEEPLAASVCKLGLIPGELTGSLRPGVAFPIGEDILCRIDPGRQVVNVFTSMFLHGSWMHLIGNMWFLWLFGNNVEDAMTRSRFIVFYLLCGVAAALLQVVMMPGSGVPMVGASGAISGVMGAYLILYPRVRVYTLVPIGFILTTIALPAWVMLIYWAVLQLAGGFVGMTAGERGGVAFWAHIGGFLAGIVLVKLFVRSDHMRAHRSDHWEPRRPVWREF